MGAETQSTLIGLLPLILLFVAMYFLMIKPQRKKDKQVNEMRKSLTVGDEIVTIGGICGKVVKTKDETFVLQFGPEKTKMEMMRWAVSSITKQAPGKARENYEEVAEEEAPKKGIKRLKKESPVQEAEEAAVEAVSEAPQEMKDTVSNVEELLEDK